LCIQPVQERADVLTVQVLHREERIAAVVADVVTDTMFAWLRLARASLIEDSCVNR